MRIGGIQKTTLLDFPGMVSALLFTQGCNFHCPYCHNPQLVQGEEETLPPADVMALLEQRKNTLQGLVISGGEPTLHTDIAALCAHVRCMGYAVKLDTNGSNPQVLQTLLTEELVQYVAMDVKGYVGAYDAVLCAPQWNTAVVQSLALLRQGKVPYELRITCVAPFVTPQNFRKIMASLPHDIPIYLQQARTDAAVLDPAYMQHTGHAVSASDIAAMCAWAQSSGYQCQLR